jgi:flavin-binding protein dodecin
MAAAKTIEITGRSSTGSDDAVRQALDEARRTVRNITGIDVVSTGLRGDPLEWRALVRIAFVIERRPEGSARRSASAEAAALRLEEREG